MYNIKELKKKEEGLRKECKTHFESFFSAMDYTNLSGTEVSYFDVSMLVDLKKLKDQPGVYLILTDYKKAENVCSLEVNGLKVIYRGHGVRLRKRVESHLFNKAYNNNKGGTDYKDCIKLDGGNGINIDEIPYKKHRWVVIEHRMAYSSKLIREQAEKAYDSLYFLPIGCKR